ncbi:QsdR family transcriptional regulator [Geodermatophilus sp. FMUSA9-8]|uniref:QsdR family transcriptional regulator n=1 Tax=Geodermatophilus sp. FMUSA9-8 TaxID=3120155 RepID=UPI0030091289
MDEAAAPRSRTHATASDAIGVAARWLFEGRRIDMQGVASELGITRMTLHRRSGGRERLIGEAMWSLAEQAWIRCVSAAEVDDDPSGHELYSVRVIRSYNAVLVSSRGVRQLFDAEPDLALRLLTDAAGPIEPRMVAVTSEVIARDEAHGCLSPIIDRMDLAYALVKLAEAFLFGDLVAGRPVDVEAANRVQTALLEAGRVASRPDASSR